MLTLNDVTEGVQKTPILALVYGPPGIGKTTLAASAPGALYLPTEDGTNQLNVRRLRRPTTLKEVIGVLRQLADQKHTYQSLVIDTLTGLQTLVYAETCAIGQKKHIEDFGYGKGYAYSLAQWEQLVVELDRVRARGLHIYLLAHEITRRVPNPGGADYDQFMPDLYAKALDLLYRWVDNVFHATYKMAVVTGDKDKNIASGRGKGVSMGARILQTEWRPGAIAKNRFSMPYEIPLEFDAMYGAIEASGCVEGAVEAFAAEARAEAESLPAERREACLAVVEKAVAADDLATLRRVVNKLRASASTAPVTA